ncbi:uncharacterized protein [Euphorbia lathyris]|uniref:uncharacterized protein n=1 Tax=Euphorbia lathyris TaxID=212925 RepID=UPI00331330CB
MQMDIQARRFYGFSSSTLQSFSSSPFISHSYSYLRPFCSQKNAGQPKRKGDDENGDRFSTDWDKAWSKFKKQGKKSLFSQFSPNKYVSWNPRRSDYPLSEEVDPIKRAERSNLMLWTSPRFTLFGAIIIVTLLLVYTLLYPTR